MRKLDFRYPNHAGCFALSVWLAEQFDQGGRTTIAMHDDVLTVHSPHYKFQMSIKPALTGAYCCNVMADDTILTAVKIAHSDSEVTNLETARHIAGVLDDAPEQIRPFASHILTDEDLMRSLRVLRPGVETDLQVLALEYNQLGVGG